MIVGIEFKRIGTAVVVAMVVISGCRVYNAAKQVRTVADMQGICALIEAEKEQHRPIDEAKIRMLVAKVAGGRDGWGNQILVATRGTAEGLSYVLVSKGSD